ncbi:MAG: hypothetical protein NTX24_02920 [Candidatus Pacearchaeota archaeon]|nr:hypothetical protein [Candidatus Pacearchaeota archaeon]
MEDVLSRYQDLTFQTSFGEIGFAELERRLRKQRFIGQRDSLLHVFRDDWKQLKELEVSNQEIADALESGRFSTGYQPYPGVVVSTFGAMSRICPFDGFSGKYSETICRKGIDRKFIDFYNDLYLKYGPKGSLKRLKEIISESMPGVNLISDVDLDDSSQANNAILAAVCRIVESSYPSLEEAEKFAKGNFEDYEDYILSLFSDDAHMIRQHGLFPRNFGRKLTPKILCKVLGLRKYVR